MKKQIGTKIKTTMQKLLWIPLGEDAGNGVVKVPPVQYTHLRPSRVWTLYQYTDQSVRPELPYMPVHHQNAFLEDAGHDWNIRMGNFYYGSRVTDGGVWVLLEFDQPDAEHYGKTKATV